jgi:DNA recombination protein RmuC
MRMTDTLLILLLVLVAVQATVLLAILLPAVRRTAAAATARETTDLTLARIEAALKEDFARNRGEAADAAAALRAELRESVGALGDTLRGTVRDLSDLQASHLDSFGRQLAGFAATNADLARSLRDGLEQLRGSVEQRFAEWIARGDAAQRGTREELAAALRAFQEQLRASVEDFTRAQGERTAELDRRQGALLQATEQRMERLRETLEQRLTALQDDNNRRLEEMRVTVDEKLHRTLEERLGESFRLVSDRLELVHAGLGEMKTLATGVGDLKRVLSNVKTRGTLGEYRLEAILDQLLAPEQFARNVATKGGSRERVEFAIRLPGRDDQRDTVWLPLDSKFPQERYHALLEAYDTGNSEVVDAALRDLERAVKSMAKDIREKYLDPPATTDFAIMFLPFEGLYAEVVKRPDLFEALQRDYRVTIAGPSTLAAFLNSLQMGFRTLAIEKRSSEVWSLLGAIKTDFHRFGEMLDSVEKNLSTASNKIHDATKKTRTIARRLGAVQELPASQAALLAGPDLPPEDGDAAENDDTSSTEQPA